MRRLRLSPIFFAHIVLLVVSPSLGFHDEHVEDMQCVPCNSTTYCTGGEAYPCPANSLSDIHADSSSVDDCTCVDGYNRTGDVCYLGLPPYYWKEGIHQLCPVNMKTVSSGATSKLFCVCDPGYEPSSSGEGCVPCSLGSAKPDQSNSSCTLCGEDFFADVTGLLNCKACAENASSGSGASLCVCDAGYVVQSCAECIDGKFSTGSATVCSARALREDGPRVRAMRGWLFQ